MGGSFNVRDFLSPNGARVSPRAIEFSLIAMSSHPTLNVTQSVRLFALGRADR